MLMEKNPTPLDPCPWCGDTKDLLVADDFNGMASVYCGACVAEGPLADSRERAIFEWNARAVPAKVSEMTKFDAQLEKFDGRPGPSPASPKENS